MEFTKKKDNNYTMFCGSKWTEYRRYKTWWMGPIYRRVAREGDIWQET